MSAIEKLRSIDWGRTYKWEVEFLQPPPAPFSDFFPAHTLDFPGAGLQSEPVEGSVKSYQLPDSYSSTPITLGFYDDEDMTLHTYFRSWMKDIIGDGHYVLTLEAACRQVQIRVFNGMNQITSVKTYLVYPRGELVYAGNSDSGLISYTLDFSVAGVIE